MSRILWNNISAGICGGIYDARIVALKLRTGGSTEAGILREYYDVAVQRYLPM